MDHDCKGIMEDGGRAVSRLTEMVNELLHFLCSKHLSGSKGPASWILCLFPCLGIGWLDSGLDDLHILGICTYHGLELYLSDGR